MAPRSPNVDDLFRTVLEAIPAGIVHVDSAGLILQANGEALELLGLDRDELTQRYTSHFALETVHEDGTPCRAEDYPVSRCLATGERQPPTTIGVRRRDGSIVWAMFTAVPLKDAHGRLTGAVVTFPDVTARKLAEAAARAAEAQLRSILESAPNVIMTTDRGGIVQFVNRTVKELSREQVLGTSMFEYLVPEHRAMVRKVFEEVIASGAIVSYESTVEPAFGGGVYQTSMGPVRDGDAIVGATIVTWDMTEQRRLETRLSIADRMASIGQLAAGVAHEINNPLTYLLGSLEWLARRIEKGGVDPEALRGPLAAAAEGASRIRHIVRDLGTFAHAGDRPTAPIDVRPMMDSALRMAQSEVRCRARVTREYGDVPRIWANDARLGQVFLNLVVNAAQAIPEGNVDGNEILVRTRTDAAGRVVVEVADTGAGVPAGMLESIFDPFVTTKSPGVGTGLGLFICRNIVSTLDGTITAEHREGGGSLFRVSLPVGTAPADLPRTPPSAAPVGRRLRVLVVDDEPGIVTLLEQLLESHDVTTARTGREALALMKTNDFDAVLCDLVMPDLTGMDVYEALRTEGAGREQKIILMTGGAFTRRAREFLDGFPGRVVEKPFTANALERALAGLE